MSKYVLIGIPNCGKSTLGRQAADILQLPFFDTDVMAYNKLKLENPFDLLKPSVLMKLRDEQYYAMLELSKYDGSAIIATGAEIALMPECVELMKNMGTIIHIERKFETVLDEIKKDDNKGLVFCYEKSGTEIVAQEENVRIYSCELSQYEALSDITMENNGSENEGVEKLVTLINSFS